MIEAGGGYCVGGGWNGCIPMLRVGSLGRYRGIETMLFFLAFTFLPSLIIVLSGRFKAR